VTVTSQVYLFFFRLLSGAACSSKHIASGITKFERFCSWRSYPDRNIIPPCVWRDWATPRRNLNGNCDTPDKIRTRNLLEYKPKAFLLHYPVAGARFDTSASALATDLTTMKFVDRKFHVEQSGLETTTPLCTSLFPETGVLTAKMYANMAECVESLIHYFVPPHTPKRR
jgi:hypothetical protein